MAEEIELVDRLYVGLAIDRDYKPRPNRLTFGDIVRFVGGMTNSLTADQTLQLFANQPLIRWYRQRLATIAIAEIPRVAAASSGQIRRRQFDGGSLTVSNSFGTFVNVFIELDEGRRHSALDLFLMSATGAEILSLQSAPDEDGKIVEQVDTVTPRKKLIVEMLCDPLAVGWFVPRRD
jgi:hypothetical protein